MKEAFGALLVILAIAFVAPLLSGAVTRSRVPALVFEILLGIVVGPQVLDLVEISAPIDLLAALGLAALMFQAGFELDPQRVRGRPINLAVAGWLLSVVIGLGAGIVLQVFNVISAELFVGLALTTTALGTLLPIVRDGGMLQTRFGTHVLAVGSVGEFGPIVAIALLLSQASPSRSALALVLFAVATLGAVVLATRMRPGRLHAALSRSLRTSAQLYVRMAVLLIALMAWIAASLGLDFLLGAFTAGLLYRVLLGTVTAPAEIDVVETKVEAISFGYLIPIFFVVTGIRYDLDSLITSPTALAKVPVFLLLFLVVRGAPMMLYRRVFPEPALRTALALLSATALPLVVAITTIGIETGQMRASTAAALVGAGMVSVVIYPIIGMALARRVGVTPAEPGAVAAPGTT